jgi:hypothetical protein
MGAAALVDNVEDKLKDWGCDGLPSVMKNLNC